MKMNLLVTPGDPGEIFRGVPDDAAFDGEDYIETKDLSAIGAALVDGREGLLPLKERKIIYLWQRQGGAAHGKAILGRCRRPRGILAAFCDADFIVTASADHVAAARFTRFQMEALLFHELCHARVDAEKGPYLIGHDYEGFCLEVTLYGAWRPDLEYAHHAFKQLSLL